MRKWIIADEYICAFLSAMGYGFGYSIPYIFGAPGWLCLAICLPCGLLLEQLAIKIIYSRYAQEKKSRKLLIFTGFILFFLIGNFVSVKIFEEPLVGNLVEEFGYVLLFEVVGFGIYMLRHHYRKTRVKEKYGNGEEGFRLDRDEKDYIKSLNRRNGKITGEFDESLAVKTRTGIYVGEKRKDVLSFTGIPFAQAPVGPLRWKAPEALPDSDEVREARYFGPSAIQVDYEGNPLRSHLQSEDCLYLNVCTADTAPDEKKPVVVYFHGGDFSFGGSADPLWDVQDFVKEMPDVIAVSFNYRLGLLGFMDFSAVPGGESYADSCNLGLLDQLAALAWVKENIAGFGGDPNRITVIGDGAGGISISLLAAGERAGGLFQNAIIFSGNPLSAELFADDSKKAAELLLKSANVSDMAGLLALTEKELRSLSQKLKACVTVPRCDGELIPADVYEAYRSGAARNVSFVLCASRDNAGVYSSSVGRGFAERLISETVGRIIDRQKPEKAEKLKKLVYDETERIGKAKAEAAFLNLWAEQVSLLKLSSAMISGGSSVRMMFWDVEATIRDLGTGSVNAVSSLLGNQDSAVAYGSVVNDSIRAVMQTLILKVIQSEDPSLYTNEVDGIDEIRWEPYPSILSVKDDGVTVRSLEETLPDAKKLLS